MSDTFHGVGVEIGLKIPEDFLKIKETLTRIGVVSEDNKTLYQSCNILHKRGQYAILHFKELFKLDGKACSLDVVDISRRNEVVRLLSCWGLLNIIDHDSLAGEHTKSMTPLKVLSHKEKQEWTLVSKYTIGKK